MPLTSSPRIRIIATGGTIAGAGSSVASSTSYLAGVVEIGTLLGSLGNAEHRCTIESQQLCRMDSKDGTPGFWQELAREVRLAQAAPEVDAVIITHGTDTLEETAWYISLVACSNKPVIFTGAMRPSTSLSADGPLNLLDAIRVAQDRGAATRGVLIVMNRKIYRARHFRKVHTYQLEAWSADEAGSLGSVQDDRISWWQPPTALAAPAFDVSTPLPPVEIVFAYAGMSLRVIEAAMGNDAGGLVWAGMGNGSISRDAEPLLEAAVRRGTIVVLSSRTGCGDVSAGRGPGTGYISAAALDPFKARIALMLALGNSTPFSHLQAVFDALSAS